MASNLEDRRIDGMYGEVYHEGKYQGDILEISGRIAIERREIPVAGTDRVAFRRGRVSREGTFRVGKVDSRFEDFILSYASKSVQDRRIDRAAGRDSFPETWFTIRVDDPDSWGAEEIQLLGVRLWEIAIGYTMGDLLEREIPFTWEYEKLIQGVPRPGNLGDWTQPQGEQTWAAIDQSDSHVIPRS
jgi:hypothetical protein